MHNLDCIYIPTRFSIFLLTSTRKFNQEFDYSHYLKFVVCKQSSTLATSGEDHGFISMDNISIGTRLLGRIQKQIRVPQ